MFPLKRHRCAHHTEMGIDRPSVCIRLFWTDLTTFSNPLASVTVERPVPRRCLSLKVFRGITSKLKTFTFNTEVNGEERTHAVNCPVDNSPTPGTQSLEHQPLPHCAALTQNKFHVLSNIFNKQESCFTGMKAVTTSAGETQTQRESDTERGRCAGPSTGPGAQQPCGQCLWE